MQALREDIKRLRRVSETGEEKTRSESFRFVPLEALFKLLSRSVVSGIIFGARGIKFYERNQDLVECVMHKGQRVFATLIMIIGDQELPIIKMIGNNLLDSKLPFTKAQLQPVLNDSMLVDSFYDWQWEFSAPILSRDVFHRILQPLYTPPSRPELRLPFIENRKLHSWGAFGELYIVRIDSEHQATPLTRDSGGKVVRQAFRCVELSEEHYKKELQCLSALNELKHPNIIGLLTSYTYNGKHNLIFPYVPDGNLSTLLEKRRPSQFSSDETFLVALCGLASAIKEVHSYTSNKYKLDIRLIGCHHDLKPDNILVQGTSLVLADFGLARVNTIGSQDTFYTDTMNDYIAPEVYNGKRTFEITAFTQSSDIWSFGCILAVLLTFMQTGPEGVAQFKAQRKALQGGGLVMNCFYGSGGTPSGPTLNWISSLKNDSDQSSGPLVELILTMLNLDPKIRPDARVVLGKLRLIVISARIRLVSGLYKTLCTILADSFDIYSESIRFKCWKSAFDAATATYSHRDQDADPQLKLPSAITCLGALYEELKSFISRRGNRLSPLFATARAHLDNLYHCLPEDSEISVKAHWEREMVSSEDLGMLEDIAHTFEGPSTNSRVGILARIKRMSITAVEGDRTYQLIRKTSSRLVSERSTTESLVQSRSAGVSKEIISTVRSASEKILNREAWGENDELVTDLEAFAELEEDSVGPGKGGGNWDSHSKQEFYHQEVPGDGEPDEIDLKSRLEDACVGWGHGARFLPARALDSTSCIRVLEPMSSKLDLDHTYGKPKNAFTLKMWPPTGESSERRRIKSGQTECPLGFVLEEDSDRLEFTLYKGVPAEKLRSRFDAFRRWLDRQVSAEIDWWPLPRVYQELPQGYMRVIWTYGGRQMSIALDPDTAWRWPNSSTADTSTPILPSWATPLTGRPISVNPPPSTGTTIQNYLTAFWRWASRKRAFPKTSTTASKPLQTPPVPVCSREAYLCADRCWTSITETKLSTLSYIDTMADDYALFTEARRVLHRAQGNRLQRFFSWRSYTRVHLSQFHFLFDNSDRVKTFPCAALALALGNNNNHHPLPADMICKGYEFTAQHGEVDIHMQIMAETILQGIRRPALGRGQRTVLGGIPKLKAPPGLRKQALASGWGFHAGQGPCVAKMGSWLLTVVGLGLLFVPVWLASVSKVDLQSAFAPVSFLVTTLGVMVAVACLVQESAAE